MLSTFDLSKPIAIGCDHAGFEYKEAVKEWLTANGIKSITDFGTYSIRSVDYPDFAHPVASSVEDGTSAFGILFCGSANGVAITANKHAGVRAGLAWNNDVATLIRLHNDANVICVPARFVSIEEAKQMVKMFMDTAFEGGRHATRTGKIPCKK